MVNEYSFGLDAPQDAYLQHDKLGAHYSKNWTKEKQNAYNKWYYEHNKDKWKDVNDANLQRARFNKDMYQMNKAIEDWARGRNNLAATYQIKNARDIVDAYSGAPGYEKVREYNDEISGAKAKREKALTNIQSDRDKLSNKVQYDIESSVEKVSKLIKNKLKNIYLNTAPTKLT